MINNSPEQIRLRRDRNTLRIVGAGTIFFGIWSLVKVFAVLFIRRQEIITAMFEEATENGIDMTGVSRTNMFRILLIMMLTALIFDLIARLYVGLSAISEGNGRRMRFPYIILAGMMIVGSFTMITVLRGGQQQEGAAEIILNNDSTLSSVLIELTSILMLLEMIIAAVRIRRLTGQVRKKKA